MRNASTQSEAVWQDWKGRYVREDFRCGGGLSGWGDAVETRGLTSAVPVYTPLYPFIKYNKTFSGSYCTSGYRLVYNACVTLYLFLWGCIEDGFQSEMSDIGHVTEEYANIDPLNDTNGIYRSATGLFVHEYFWHEVLVEPLIP
jgi:hypothetical protein